MKNALSSTLLSVLACLVLLTNPGFASATDNVFIDGYIVGFAKLDKTVYLDKTISVEYYDPLGYTQRKTANIDKQGKFKLSIFLLYPQDIQIQSGTGYYISTLVVPTDTMHMALRYFKIKQATQGYPEVHYRTDFENAFSGPNAKRYEGFLANYLKAGKLPLVTPDDATVTGGVTLLNEKLAKVTQTVKTEFSTADAVTANWLNGYLSYKLIEDFFSKSEEKQVAVDYRKIKYPTNLTDNASFFAAVKKIQIPDSVDTQFRLAAVLDNPNFSLNMDEIALVKRMFLGKATPADTLKAKIFEKEFQDNKKAITSSDSAYIVATVAYQAANYPPRIADFANGRLVKSEYLNSFFNQIKPKLFEGISSQMQTYLTGEILSGTASNKNITYTKSTEADIVKMLIAKYPGQNLYVDLWATWCAPCRAEFPYYPEVMEKYKGKVTFVFLCGASEENAYKAVLGNLNFKGNHFFLNTRQYTNYKNTFGIVGIPHYLFITKDGKITNNFKRPSAHLDLYAAIDAEIGQ